jgi:hypothetical protein
MSDEEILSTEDEVITPEVETETKSMDDTIRETLEQINSRGEETEEQAEQRLRDERGRFARKEAQEIETPVEAVETPQEFIVPPELQKLGLRKEEAEVIAKDPAVMAAFVRRSEEMHRGLEQYRSKAQSAEAFEQALSPFMPTIQQSGMSPAEAAHHLFATEHALRYGSPEQKLQMLHKIASDYGIDMGQAQEFAANQPPADPRVNQLQQQLQQMQSWVQQQNQAREWQERQTLNSEIEKFTSDPAHIYFEQVRGDMAGLLQAGLARDLKDAYEKAIYANPEVRQQVLAKQQAEQAEKARKEAAEKAQAAKQAAAVNLSRRGTLPAKKPIGSMDDTIREKAQELGLI